MTTDGLQIDWQAAILALVAAVIVGLASTAVTITWQNGATIRQRFLWWMMMRLAKLGSDVGTALKSPTMAVSYCALRLGALFGWGIVGAVFIIEASFVRLGSHSIAQWLLTMLGGACWVNGTFNMLILAALFNKAGEQRPGNAP